MSEELKFKATLDGKQFIATITQMEGRAKSSAAEMFTAVASGANVALEAATVAFKGIEGGFSLLKNAGSVLGSGVKDVFDYTRNLENLSERTGISVGRLRDLTRTFEAAGLEADDAGSAVNRMQKFLQEAEDGETKNSDLLRKLGLSFLQLHQLSPEQQFERLGKAVAGMHDPMAQTQAAMEVFSRSGGRLLTIFNDPNFRTGGPLSARAQQLQDNAAAFNEASVKLSRAGDVFKSFYTGAAIEFARPLAAALDAFEKTDLSKYGEAFADYVLEGAAGVLEMLVAIKQSGFVEEAETFGGWLKYGATALVDAAQIMVKIVEHDLKEAFSLVKSLGLDKLLPGAGAGAGIEAFLKAGLGDAATANGMPGLFDKFFADLERTPGSAANKGAGARVFAAAADDGAPGRVTILGGSSALDDMTSTGIRMRERLGISTDPKAGIGGRMEGLSGLFADTGETSRQSTKQIRDSLLYENPLLLNNAGALNAAVAQEQQRQRQQDQIKQYQHTYDLQHPVEAQAREAAKKQKAGATSKDISDAAGRIENAVKLLLTS